MNITDVHVSNYTKFAGHGRAAIGWNADGARFHVWVDIHKDEKLKLTSDIYKNPPLYVDRKDAGHFDTSKLNANIAKNAAIIKQAFDVVKRDGLIGKEIAVEQEKENARLAEIAEDTRIHRIKEAGPDLLEALQGLLADITEYQTINKLGGENNHWQVRARAAIEKATK